MAEEVGGLSREGKAGGTAAESASKQSPFQLNDSTEVDLSLPELPTSRASNRRNTGLLLTAATCFSVLAIGDYLTDSYLAGDYYGWLLAVTAFNWLAYFQRAHRLLPIYVVIIGVLALHSIFSRIDQVEGVVMMAATALLLLWTGLLVHPLLNLSVAFYAIFTIVYYDFEFVSNFAKIQGTGTISVPFIFAYTTVPFAIATALRYWEKHVQNRLENALEILQQQQKALVQSLERKATELELSRAQLMQAQKLKTVGTMASGLAHELNNILTPIRGLAELIAQGVSSDQASRYGQRILDSAVAAAQITGALLTYTRQGTFHPVRSNARQLLQSQILPVLSKSLPGNIRLRVDFARNVSIDVDRLLFQQCITNLVFNAVDAMPNGGEITISLSTSTRPCDKEKDTVDVTLEGGPCSAVITVSDTGTGIAPEDLSQIFDPFFTTKAVGSGTGLGLAMVQGTVTRHGGRVLVESTPGQGTTFTIMLPLAHVEERDMPKSWPVLRGETQGPVVVVVTEDQDALDEFEELLEATECAPICTSDARAANTLLTEMGDKVDLLILDAELEKHDARKIFRTIREMFPSLPILLLSDMPTDPMLQRMIGAGPTRSVRKPMDPGLFATLMTDLLQPASGYVRDFTPVPVGPRNFTDTGPNNTP